MNATDITKIVQGLTILTEMAHAESTKAGWWNEMDGHPLAVPAKLCLVHSEISEAMEAHRKGLMDDKLPHRQGIEVELADALIRIGDLAGSLGLDLGSAVVEKMLFNRMRADHKPENRVAAGGKKY
jgi:NTP pyrophosphatase (non-canonical NTP hydrolase)